MQACRDVNMYVSMYSSKAVFQQTSQGCLHLYARHCAAIGETMLNCIRASPLPQGAWGRWLVKQIIITYSINPVLEVGRGSGKHQGALRCCGKLPGRQEDWIIKDCLEVSNLRKGTSVSGNRSDMDKRLEARNSMMWERSSVFLGLPEPNVQVKSEERWGHRGEQRPGGRVVCAWHSES